MYILGRYKFQKHLFKIDKKYFFADLYKKYFLYIYKIPLFLCCLIPEKDLYGCHIFMLGVKIVDMAKIGIKLFQVVFMLFVLTIFTYRRYKKGIRGYKYLNLTIIFGLIQSFIEYTVDLVYEKKYPSIDLDHHPISKLHHIPYAFLLLCLLLYFRYFVGINFTHVIISILFIDTYLTTYTLEFIFRYKYITNDVVVNDWIFMWIFDLYQLYIFLVCFYSSAKLYWQNRKSKVALPTFLFALSFFVSVISSIIEFQEHITGFELYGALLFGVTVLIIFMIYVLSPKFVYVTPVRVFRFLVLDKNSTTLFSVNYRIHTTSSETMMLGAAIGAFTAFISDITQAPERTLKTVELKERVIIVQPYENIFGILIAEKKIPLFNNTLKLFTSEFYKRYAAEIRNFTGNTSVFDSAIKLLPQFFPYLQEEYLSFE